MCYSRYYPDTEPARKGIALASSLSRRDWDMRSHNNGSCNCKTCGYCQEDAAFQAASRRRPSAPRVFVPSR
jgi:hypothetical protein